MTEPDQTMQDAGPRPGGLRVLLIDDHAFVLQAIKNLLEVDGHFVSCAESGLKGIALLEDALAQGTPFTLVITDFSMPEMDGGEVARRVKLAHPSTRVVVLTGWGPEVEVNASWKRNVDDFMGKPPRLAELRRVLADARR